MKLLNKIFPILEYLFVLQQEEYLTSRYVDTVFSNFHKRIWRENQSLKFTGKIILLLLVSLLLFLIFIYYGRVIFLSEMDLFALILFAIYLAFIFYLTPLFVACANIVIWPLDFFVKLFVRKNARRKLQKFDRAKIIGITGSFGKSTTRHILVNLLKSKYQVVTPEKNINTDIGVARFILRHCEELSDEAISPGLPPPDKVEPRNDIKYLVLEMGAYKKGEIKKLCKIAPPDVAMVTGIGPQHIERFGSLEKIKQGKAEIIEHAKENAEIYLNNSIEDLEFFRKIANAKKVTTYGFGVNADVQVKNLFFEELKTKFTFRAEEFTSNFLGEHLVQDVAGALSVALDLGVEKEKAKKVLASLSPLPRRMQASVVNEITFIDDSYNINPISAKAALETIKVLSGKNRIVVVTGGIVEQGKDSARINEAWGRELATKVELVILSETKYSDSIKQGIKAAKSKIKVKTSTSSAQTQEILQGDLHAGDFVLIQNELPDIYH